MRAGPRALAMPGPDSIPRLPLARAMPRALGKAASLSLAKAALRAADGRHRLGVR